MVTECVTITLGPSSDAVATREKLFTAIRESKYCTCIIVF